MEIEIDIEKELYANFEESKKYLDPYLEFVVHEKLQLILNHIYDSAYWKGVEACRSVLQKSLEDNGHEI